MRSCQTMSPNCLRYSIEHLTNELKFVFLLFHQHFYHSVYMTTFSESLPCLKTHTYALKMVIFDRGLLTIHFTIYPKALGHAGTEDYVGIAHSQPS